MGLLASQLAARRDRDRDPPSRDRLAAADDEVDALRRHLLDILYTPDWPHGVHPAVNVR
ncbi:MAG: hypothetical protein WCC65_13205 [Pseudonocardiaceae bacterium]